MLSSLIEATKAEANLGLNELVAGLHILDILFKIWYVMNVYQLAQHKTHLSLDSIIQQN